MFKKLLRLAGVGREAPRLMSHSPSQATEPVAGEEPPASGSDGGSDGGAGEESTADGETGPSPAEEPAPRDPGQPEELPEEPSKELVVHDHVPREPETLSRFAERVEALGGYSDDRLRVLAMRGVLELEEVLGDASFLTDVLPDLPAGFGELQAGLDPEREQELEGELDAAREEIERLGQELAEKSRHGDRERGRLQADIHRAEEGNRERNRERDRRVADLEQQCARDLSLRRKLEDECGRMAKKLSASRSRRRELEQQTTQVTDELTRAAAQVWELARSVGEALGADEGPEPSEGLHPILERASELSMRLLEEHYWRRAEMAAIAEILERPTWRFSGGLQRRVRPWSEWSALSAPEPEPEPEPEALP